MTVSVDRKPQGPQPVPALITVSLGLTLCLITGCSTSPKYTAFTCHSSDQSPARTTAGRSITQSFPSVQSEIPTNLTNTNPKALRDFGSGTNAVLYSLPPPLLELPEQRAAREELEQSRASPALVKKMLAGEVLSLAEIQELAQKNISDATITKYLRSTGAVYLFNTEQIDRLRASSVSDSVVNYLLSTSAYRTTPVYYPVYLPTYSSRLFSPWGHDHHHFEFHHDLHYDVHH